MFGKSKKKEGETTPDVTLTNEEEISKLFHFLKAKYATAFQHFDESIFIGDVLTHVAAENTINALHDNARANGHEDHYAYEQHSRDEAARAIMFPWVNDEGQIVTDVSPFNDEADMVEKTNFSHTQHRGRMIKKGNLYADGSPIYIDDEKVGGFTSYKEMQEFLVSEVKRLSKEADEAAKRAGN